MAAQSLLDRPLDISKAPGRLNVDMYLIRRTIDLIKRNRRVAILELAGQVLGKIAQPVRQLVVAGLEEDNERMHGYGYPPRFGSFGTTPSPTMPVALNFRSSVFQSAYFDGGSL